MELVVIRSGAGVVRTGFERFDAAAGDVFVFTPGMLHGIEQADGQRMDYENILFSLDLLGGREDVWYCTNIEFMDAMDDFRRLEFSADNTFVFNPNCRDCWIRVNDASPICIPAGQLVSL